MPFTWAVSGPSLSAHADVLEPVRPAVLLVQEGFAVSQFAGNTALALLGVGAVEEGDMLISNVAEPTER
jgi:hypothetical protein